MTSESSVAGHTPGPWIFDEGCQIVEVARPHMRVCFLPSDHAKYASSEPNGYLIAAAPEMFQALREWKCPGCGGSGKYEQDKAGRARNAKRGRMNDPRYQPEPVTCKVCGGDGLHPIACAALAKATGGA